MTTQVTEQAQQSLDEQPLNNENLKKALEEWGIAKGRLKGPRKAYAAINATVKELIDQADLDDGSYRCGPWIIKLSQAEGKRIEFERATRQRISITPAKT
jgi:hypothetical protein